MLLILSKGPDQTINKLKICKEGIDSKYCTMDKVFLQYLSKLFHYETTAYVLADGIKRGTGITRFDGMVFKRKLQAGPLTKIHKTRCRIMVKVRPIEQCKATKA